MKLLEHTDDMEKQTGDPGADFRKEAFDYIAGSLTYLDFTGPDETEPYVIRLDVLDTEPPPADHPLLRAKNCYVTPHIVPYEGGAIPQNAYIEKHANMAFIGTGVGLLSASLPPLRYSTTRLRRLCPCAAARSERNAGAANPTVKAATPPRTNSRLLIGMMSSRYTSW